MKFQLVETAYITYVFDGPIYDDTGLVDAKKHKETMAISRKQAINNIRYQLRQEYRRLIEFDASLVKEAKIKDIKKSVNKAPVPEYADGSEQISMF